MGPISGAPNLVFTDVRECHPEVCSVSSSFVDAVGLFAEDIVDIAESLLEHYPPNPNQLVLAQMEANQVSMSETPSEARVSLLGGQSGIEVGSGSV